MVLSKADAGFAIQREIKKHFISNDGQIMSGAKLVKFAAFLGFGEVSRGIIRMNHNHCARARRDRGFQSMKVNLPAVVVNKRIAHKFYILDIRKEIEKRVAGRG